MAEAVIVDGVRTPFVRAGTALRHLPAQQLGRLAARELLYRLDMRPSDVDELIAGNVATPADAANIGRVIALMIGMPRDRIAHTVSRNCASGFECVTEAVERIRSGRASTVLAVGVESMSNIPVMWNRDAVVLLLEWATARGLRRKLSVLRRIRARHFKPHLALKTGLTDPFSGLILGETAEKLAREFGISRREQDEFALGSHQKAARAWENGTLGQETMCVYRPADGDAICKDIGPRPQQSLAALGKLRPYFDRKYGTVTVGNSCQVTDGAAALLVMAKERAEAAGFKPLGRVKAYAYAGCEPERMGLGPVYATSKLLKSTDCQLSDIGLIELNEAFAAQVLACARAFASRDFACNRLDRPEAIGTLDMERVNVHGGAIAMGHPVGTTGTRLVLTLLKEMRRRECQLGLATLCVGGGQGGSLLLEQ